MPRHAAFPQRLDEKLVKIIRSLDPLPDAFRHGAVSIGNFDGVHLGHARIVERLVESARRVGGPAIVFTFDPHPAALLRPHRSPPPLSTVDRKAELLAELGVDAMIAYRTDLALLRLDAPQFFGSILQERLAARAVVEGANFSFGRGREGNVELLRGLCAEAALLLEIVPPVALDGQIVSSSLARTLIAEGQIERAQRMLTRPYRVYGKVVHGAGRGRKLGFPTANLAEVRTLLPREGIYAGQMEVDGRAWPAAISLGPNPTFNEQGLKVEAHLIGFDGDLYDRWLGLDFLARLRGVERLRDRRQAVGPDGSRSGGDRGRGCRGAVGLSPAEPIRPIHLGGGRRPLSGPSRVIL